MREKILWGKWQQDSLDRLLRGSASISDVGARIGHLSKQFLGTEYRESTMTGSISVPEVFVIDLSGVDCFTFLDYIEAMRSSASFDEFRKNLLAVRYRSGKASYENRNHFFTDWTASNAALVEDVTEKTGGDKVRHITKILNKKDDGTHFLDGISCVERDIAYIPAELIDDLFVSNLRTGDYLGIYTETPGLDVSHVGIFIRTGDIVTFRHASSSEKHRKVVDEDLREYITGKPGIIVLRPK